MGFFSRLLRRERAGAEAMDQTADTEASGLSEIGRRSTTENAIKHIYNRFWADPALWQTILDIRSMDKQDGRVKKIHGRMARDTIKGGVLMTMPKDDSRVRSAWREFSRRIGIDNPMKLKSDARGLIIEGSLPYQWAVSSDGRVAAGIRMPSETLVPLVSASGRFESADAAWRQIDPITGSTLAEFALYQLTVGRLDPDNFDDLGCMGRPYLDASRTVWEQLRMTEEDMVVRRRVRAPLRMVHVLEGAQKEEMDAYREQVENDQNEITTDYYINRKGAVNPVQGDANLDQIADVAHLIDTFFAGSPAPKGLFGYVGDLARDVLEDIKRDYYEEVDGLQDVMAWVYRQGFILELLLRGINPLDYDFEVKFAERRTESANQSADLGLKWQALGMPTDMIWRRQGEDPEKIRTMLEAQRKRRDPYPDPGNIRPQSGGAPRVSVTPGNQPKGESATSITTRS